jgi:hypothetical protein
LHRAFSLSKRQVVVFCAIVEAFVRPVIEARYSPALRRSIEAKLVCDDPFGHKALAFEQPAQKPFCRPFVPPGLDNLFQNDTMLIDRTPEPELFTRDLQNDFVQMPNVARTGLPLPKITGNPWPKFDGPPPDALV